MKKFLLSLFLIILIPLVFWGCKRHTSIQQTINITENTKGLQEVTKQKYGIDEDTSSNKSKNDQYNNRSASQSKSNIKLSGKAIKNFKIPNSIELSTSIIEIKDEKTIILSSEKKNELIKKINNLNLKEYDNFDKSKIFESEIDIPCGGAYNVICNYENKIVVLSFETEKIIKKIENNKETTYFTDNYNAFNELIKYIVDIIQKVQPSSEVN